MTKSRIFTIAFIVGIATGIARAVYLHVNTKGMDEIAFTVIYGSDWGTMLPLSVVTWAVFGFLLVPAVALMAVRGTSGVAHDPQNSFWLTAAELCKALTKLAERTTADLERRCDKSAPDAQRGSP